MTDAEDTGATVVSKLSDELEFEPVVPPLQRKRRGLRLFLLFTFLLAATGATGWYFLGDKLLGSGRGQVPMLIAELGPVKVRPENPGGMKVPDRDKLVYERMDGAEDNQLVERLLPPPESPLPPPTPKPEVSPSTSAAPTEKPVASLPAIPTTEEVLAAKKPPAMAPIQLQTKSQPKETKKTKPAETAVKKAAKPAGNGSHYKVQLAAVRSMELARQEWKRLSAKHADILKNLQLSTTKVDLGAEKGVFYRLRAGPIADEAKAKSICSKLAERKMGCLVVRPKD